MTGFDIAVLVMIGMGAITGFMRGFVQEVLALAPKATKIAGALAAKSTPASMPPSRYAASVISASGSGRNASVALRP